MFKCNVNYEENPFPKRRGLQIICNSSYLSEEYEYLLQELAPCLKHFQLKYCKLVAGLHRASPSTTPDKSPYEVLLDYS